MHDWHCSRDFDRKRVRNLSNFTPRSTCGQLAPSTLGERDNTPEVESSPVVAPLDEIGTGVMVPGDAIGLLCLDAPAR